MLGYREPRLASNHVCHTYKDEKTQKVRKKSNFWILFVILNVYILTLVYMFYTFVNSTCRDKI